MQSTVVVPQETTELLKIAAMLERLAAEIRRVLLLRDRYVNGPPRPR